MRLTDLVSGANLDLFATVSMILFLLAFAAVMVRVLTMPRRDAQAAAHLPLEDRPSPKRPVEDRPHAR